MLSAIAVSAVLISAAPDARSVVRTLDVTSFPNSLGPRRRPDARTFADYGFTQIEDDGDGVVVREDPSWAFTVKVMTGTADRAVLCIVDQAQGSGTYLAVTPLEVKFGADGYWRATGREPPVDGCEKMTR